MNELERLKKAWAGYRKWHNAAITTRISYEMGEGREVDANNAYELEGRGEMVLMGCLSDSLDKLLAVADAAREYIDSVPYNEGGEISDRHDRAGYALKTALAAVTGEGEKSPGGEDHAGGNAEDGYA